MSKPLDQLAQIAAGIQTEQQVAADAKQAIGCAIRIRDQWLGHMAELSQLAQRSGLDNILAVAESIHADAPTIIGDLLTAAQAFHTAMTDEPFPDLPADPVPPAEPEPEDEPQP